MAAKSASQTFATTPAFCGEACQSESELLFRDVPAVERGPAMRPCRASRSAAAESPTRSTSRVLATRSHSSSVRMVGLEVPGVARMIG